MFHECNIASLNPGTQRKHIEKYTATPVTTDTIVCNIKLSKYPLVRFTAINITTAAAKNLTISFRSMIDVFNFLLNSISRTIELNASANEWRGLDRMFPVSIFWLKSRLKIILMVTAIILTITGVLVFLMRKIRANKKIIPPKINPY